MKKLLMAVGQNGPDMQTLDFASYLARLTGARLTGIFLESLKHEEVLVGSIRDDAELKMPEVPYGVVDADEEVRTRSERHIGQFKEGCIAREVVFRIHRDRGVPWKEMMSECRYADAIIVNAGFTMDGEEKHVPTHDVKKLLHDSECPVIVAPPAFHQIDELVLAFDGTASSVFAIRQFIQLFPQLADRKAVVLQIASDVDDLIEERYRLKEWLKEYFPLLEFMVLEGDAEHRLLEYLMSRHNAFVVMGGYGRDRFSRIVHPSNSAPLVSLLSSPIFIAHR